MTAMSQVTAASNSTVLPSTRLEREALPAAVRAEGPIVTTTDAREADRQLATVPANPTLQLAAPAASERRFPANLCYRPERCGVEMERIWNAFSAAGPVNPADVPKVFSGNMYWMSSSYNPNTAHFGGVLLDRQPDQSTSFNARWAFYGPGNPYTATTLDEARRSWAARPQLVQDRTDHYYVDANPRTQTPGWVPIEYWLRQDPTTRDIYVVGFFGNGQFALGQLQANQAQ